jgi:hypothetical protein
MTMEKGIIIVNESLPVGLKANVCAVLGMSLGKRFPDLVGKDVLTQDGKKLVGITQIPLPILQSSSANLTEALLEYRDSEIFIVTFDDSALTTKTYPEFEEKISATNLNGVVLHGLLAYGSRKIINKISADLPLLR